jgi:carboxypeptidase family protein
MSRLVSLPAELVLLVTIGACMFACKQEEAKQSLQNGSASPAVKTASCPSLQSQGIPKNSLYTLIYSWPQGVKCVGPPDHIIGGKQVKDYGTVALPLRGWVGCNGEQPLDGATVEAYSADGKLRLESTTTNPSGRFRFPDLKSQASYRLKVTGSGISSTELLVSPSRQSDAEPCVIALAAEDAR